MFVKGCTSLVLEPCVSVKLHRESMYVEKTRRKKSWLAKRTFSTQIHRDARTILGQWEQQEQKGIDWHSRLFGAPYNIGTALDMFVPSFRRGYISHNYANSSPFQSYITYLYSSFDLCYIISKSEKDSTAFQKEHLCSPCSTKRKAGEALAPFCPPFPESLLIHIKYY